MIKFEEISPWLLTNAIFDPLKVSNTRHTQYNTVTIALVTYMMYFNMLCKPIGSH